MLGPSHRLAGTAAWLATAPLLGVHGWQWLAGAGIAGIFAHGRTSPDIDIYPILRTLIPGGHRGITHWWPVTATAFLAAPLAGDYRWIVLAIAVAWASHIITDAMFGRVPVWPARGKHRWHYAGIGWRTGGLIEKAIAVPAFSLLISWTLLSAAG